MRPASTVRHGPASARLITLDAEGSIEHHPSADLSRVLRPGDLLAINDAATLPASLSGVHRRTERAIELRLATRLVLDPREARAWDAIVFGEGDWRARTEERPLPPLLRIGDSLAFEDGFEAEIIGLHDHPRWVSILFRGSARDAWEHLIRHGRPVQYSHLRDAMAVWDIQTPLAGPPVAVEPPSAGFVLSHELLDRLREVGVEIATLTHAAGLSSTGDAALDACLPFDEPYAIPEPTARAVARASAEGRRIVALGTTVVRALESAADDHGAVRPGPGIARSRIDRSRPPRVLDAVVTGIHEPGSSHHALLEGFADPAALARVAEQVVRHGYLAHEFGDYCLVEKRQPHGPRVMRSALVA